LIRAVVDTNVIVSGLLFGGIPFKVIKSGLAKNFVWVTSPNLMEETERVMRSPKFGLSDREVRVLISPIFSITEIVIPVNTLEVIERCQGIIEFLNAPWRENVPLS